MRNLKMIEVLKNEGLKFVDNGDWEYDRFILKLGVDGNVKYVDLEEDDFSKNLGKKDVIGFIEKGIEEGVFEFVEDDEVVYFDFEREGYFDEFLDLFN